jgi:hypothetical protein
MNMVIPALALAAALLVAGCTKLGPNYTRPDTAVLDNWREMGGKA